MFKELVSMFSFIGLFVTSFIAFTYFIYQKPAEGKQARIPLITDDCVTLVLLRWGTNWR